MNFKRATREKPMPEPFDVNTIENDIAELATGFSSRPTPLPPGPSLMIAEKQSDIGQLSAAAVEEMYKTAASAIDAMGVDLLEVARSVEKMAADVKVAIEFVRQTADAYREEAGRIKARIEAANDLTVKVREACEDMRTKINLAAPAPE